MTQEHAVRKESGSTIAKELVFGLMAVCLGVYNLLAQLGILDKALEIPQAIGNVLLVLVGLLLWITAYRLWRYRWHTRRLF